VRGKGAPTSHEKTQGRTDVLKAPVKRGGAEKTRGTIRERFLPNRKGKGVSRSRRVEGRPRNSCDDRFQLEKKGPWEQKGEKQSTREGKYGGADETLRALNWGNGKEHKKKKGGAGRCREQVFQKNQRSVGDKNIEDARGPVKQPRSYQGKGVRKET